MLTLYTAQNSLYLLLQKTAEFISPP